MRTNLALEVKGRLRQTGNLGKGRIVLVLYCVKIGRGGSEFTRGNNNNYRCEYVNKYTEYSLLIPIFPRFDTLSFA